MSTVNLTVNGKPISADVEPRTSLADFLRDTLDLTGTHLGCEQGVCGACTILVDGVPTRSCLTLALSCEKSEVTTIEGLDDDEIADELRASFTNEHALQCGFCTPGMIVSAHDLVQRMEQPDEQAIRYAMSGNLCRCTGYVGITRAVQTVIRDRRDRGIPALSGGGRTALGPAGAGFADALAATETEGQTVSGEGKPAPRKDTEAKSAPVVSMDDDWTPKSSFTESFVVGHPVDEVWDYFGHVDKVAACLPGASLTGAPRDDLVEGSIRVKVGPMSPEFHGVAKLTRDDANRTGTITGSGKDRRSNSTTRGQIIYQIKEDDTPGQTRVDVTIGYTLTGVLAQFGRPGLVRDVANRLISAFVVNLESSLTNPDKTVAAPITELNAGSLISSIILGRIKRFFNALTGRK